MFNVYDLESRIYLKLVIKHNYFYNTFVFAIMKFGMKL